MGKATGFLEYTRQNNIDRAPLERLQDYCEFHLPLSSEERRQQGARCMNCGVPLSAGRALHELRRAALPERNEAERNGDRMSPPQYDSGVE